MDITSNHIELIAMEGKTKAVVAVVIVAVIAIAAAAIVLNNGGTQTSSDNDMRFMIQDDKGVYFWIEGSGETVLDAFKDATKSFDVPFTPSTNAGVDSGIQSLFGLEMKQVGNDWYWWVQMEWKDGKWTDTVLGMNVLKPKDIGNVMAVAYGSMDLDRSKIAAPSDAVVWDKSTKGTVFTIQSSSGLYFKVNGEGKTVLDAFKTATEGYKIPFVASSDATGDNGIKSLFGLEMYQESETVWHYWTQYTWTDGAWADSLSFMSGINSADNPQFKVAYV